MGKKFYAMMAVLAFATGSMDVNAVYTLDGIEVSADRKPEKRPVREYDYRTVLLPDRWGCAGY